MKKLIKEITGFLFRFSGIFFLIREVFYRKKVTIIVYHNPQPQIFKRHIEYLAKKYNFISLGRLVEAIDSKDWSDIPPKGLVVTIDDGYRENYRLLEIFKTDNIKPTIYLCSDIVNTNRKLWFRTGYRNFQSLKKHDSQKRLEVLRDTTDYEPRKEYSTRQTLDLAELREMSPYVDFQSHSKFHPVLTTCPDQECQEEIGGSKENLEKLLNKKIEHYSYPNGDYSGREIELVKNSGYKSARTLDLGRNSIHSDSYRLRAMCVEDDASINVLSVQINGFFLYFKYLRHGSLRGKQPSFL